MTLTKPRKIALGIAAAVLAICGLGAALSGGDEPTTPANAASPATVTTDGSAQPAPPVEATTPAAPALTVAQQNAARSAHQYVDYSGFSRSGLIKQLEFEGYSTADATLAVDSIAVDWMAEAAESAKQYMSYSAFSRSGLIKQLEFEGFTPEQAAHGADSVGL
jgi:hypothetical protein